MASLAGKGRSRMKRRETKEVGPQHSELSVLKNVAITPEDLTDSGFNLMLNEITQNEEQAQETQKRIKKSWVVGSKVEIYSSSLNRWFDGQVIRIFADTEGEWLEIKYSDNKVKQIQRLNEHIRPLRHARKVPNGLNETREMDMNWDRVLPAIDSGNIAFIKTFITSNNININEPHPETGKTLLMYSVIAGNYELVAMICRNGSNVNIKDNEKSDALYYAIIHGDSRIIEFLYYKQLTGALGEDLRDIATQLYAKQQESKLLLAFKHHGGGDEVHLLRNLIVQYIIKAVQNREEFSKDLLFNAWYFVTHDEKTQENPLESDLFKAMMATYSKILRNTDDTAGWEWMKKYFIDSLIWFLPHPHRGRGASVHEPFTINEEKSAETFGMDANPSVILENTLFWELLIRVRKEAKRQSNLLLNKEILKLKHQKTDEWKALTEYDVISNGKHSDNARQDVCAGIKPKWTEEQLNGVSSVNFDAKMHYDHNIYLNEILLCANALDVAFQKEVRKLSEQICDEYNGSILTARYRAAPVKTLQRSQLKLQNEHSNAPYPSSAQLLDLSRCQLQFTDIASMMQFMSILETKIKTNQTRCIKSIVRCENGWRSYQSNDPKYVDIKWNVLIQSEENKSKMIVGEIQFLLDVMSVFKKVMHKLDVVNGLEQKVYKYNQVATEIQPLAMDPFVSRSIDSNLNESPPMLSNSAVSMRQASVRTFGELFSTQFQHATAHSYKRSQSQFHQQDTAKQNKIVQYFHDNYYGQNEVFESPFGYRPVIYCDWTASGKVLECVEKYLEKEMYTLYANTHTTTSITGIQTSKFRSEARSIILASLGGDPDEDAVVFTGSGVTGAIYKLSHILMQSVSRAYKPETTIVFVSIYEHNSNLFIWSEQGCKLIVVPEDGEQGGLDMKYLEKKLKQYSASHMKHKYNLLIGSFTAASNVSGIIAPVEETTALLHKYGAFSFWDYATAGPYLDVNMTNPDAPLLSKDAVFISTHKYLAGPGAPGILCAKKHLFQNYVPVIAGGGTVYAAYGVEDGEFEYLDNIEEREEGGTGDIIGSIRAALAFMIKDHLTTAFIEKREKQYLEYFWNECKAIDNLIMMGNTECERLPVLSFLITHTKKGFGAAKKTKYLHYNFIAALFNDMFGIQGRGGCACAGMYGKYVLNISDKEVDHVVSQLRDNKNELARPGYFRINLHYTMNKEELAYVVNAVKFVCSKGWLFVALYDVDPETGNYVHRNMQNKNKLRSLLDVSFTTNNTGHQMTWKKKPSSTDTATSSVSSCVSSIDTEAIIRNLRQCLPPSMDEFGNENRISDESAWYWLPSELYQDTLNYLQ
eukprot:997407_1